MVSCTADHPPEAQRNRLPEHIRLCLLHAHPLPVRMLSQRGIGVKDPHRVGPPSGHRGRCHTPGGCWGAWSPHQYLRPRRVPAPRPAESGSTPRGAVRRGSTCGGAPWFWQCWSASSGHRSGACSGWVISSERSWSPRPSGPRPSLRPTDLRRAREDVAAADSGRRPCRRQRAGDPGEGRAPPAAGRPL